MNSIDFSPAKKPYKLIPLSKKISDQLMNGESTNAVKPASPAAGEPKCSQCRSRRIVKGSMADSERGRCFFAPAGLRFWTITKSYGTKVESFACLDCGLVWMHTPPKMLEDFVQKYCDQKVE